MTHDIDIGETEKLYLPWHHNDNGLITGTADDPESEDYPDIADLAQEPGIEGPGDKFRADFIVLACNAHHGLVEAGEEVIATWEKGDLAAAVRKLDAALRQSTEAAMSKHTKETWCFGIKSGDSELIVAGGAPIALVIPDHCTAREFQANCDLIVNSPLLFKALEAWAFADADPAAAQI